MKQLKESLIPWSMEVIDVTSQMTEIDCRDGDVGNSNRVGEADPLAT